MRLYSGVWITNGSGWLFNDCRYVQHFAGVINYCLLVSVVVSYSGCRLGYLYRPSRRPGMNVAYHCRDYVNLH